MIVLYGSETDTYPCLVHANGGVWERAVPLWNAMQAEGTAH